MNEVEAIRAEEIEIRVQQVTEKGAQLLLYKDSRCDYWIKITKFTIGNNSKNKR